MNARQFPSAFYVDTTNGEVYYLSLKPQTDSEKAYYWLQSILTNTEYISDDLIATQLDKNFKELSAAIGSEAGLEIDTEKQILRINAEELMEVAKQNRHIEPFIDEPIVDVLDYLQEASFTLPLSLGVKTTSSQDTITFVLSEDGSEYNFKKDGKVPAANEINTNFFKFFEKSIDSLGRMVAPIQNDTTHIKIHAVDYLYWMDYLKVFDKSLIDLKIIPSNETKSVNMSSLLKGNLNLKNILTTSLEGYLLELYKTIYSPMLKIPKTILVGIRVTHEFCLMDDYKKYQSTSKFDNSTYHNLITAFQKTYNEKRKTPLVHANEKIYLSCNAYYELKNSAMIMPASGTKFIYLEESKVLGDKKNETPVSINTVSPLFPASNGKIEAETSAKRKTDEELTNPRPKKK